MHKQLILAKRLYETFRRKGKCEIINQVVSQKRSLEVRIAHKKKNGPTFRFITFILIAKNEYRYIVFVRHTYIHNWPLQPFSQDY